MAETICGPWLAWALGTPFFRIQAILQTQDMIPNLKFKPTKGFFDTLKRIPKEEGARSFYRGGLPYLIYASARNFYEEVCRPFSENYEFEIEEEIVPFESIDGVDLKEEKKFGLGEEQGSSSRDMFSPQGFGELEKQEQMERLQKEKAVKIEEIVSELIDESEPNPIAFPGLPLSIFIVAFNALIHPLEVLRVRVATDFGDITKRKYTGMLNAGKNLVKSGGIRALYRGYLPLTSFALIQQNIFGIVASKQQTTPFDIGVWFLSDLVLYPMMVVGRRMMMLPDNPVGRYPTMMECIRETYQQFGGRGFY
ncbi:MAG: hypothetical protein EOO46_25280, partial [Flavobacterium sp.]